METLGGYDSLINTHLCLSLHLIFDGFKIIKFSYGGEKGRKDNLLNISGRLRQQKVFIQHHKITDVFHARLQFSFKVPTIALLYFKLVTINLCYPRLNFT